MQRQSCHVNYCELTINYKLLYGFNLPVDLTIWTSHSHSEVQNWWSWLGLVALLIPCWPAKVSALSGSLNYSLLLVVLTLESQRPNQRYKEYIWAPNVQNHLTLKPNRPRSGFDAKRTKLSVYCSEMDILAWAGLLATPPLPLPRRLYTQKPRRWEETTREKRHHEKRLIGWPNQKKNARIIRATAPKSQAIKPKRSPCCPP